MFRFAAPALAGFILVSPALAAPVTIVAAENFYGEIAAAVGGDAVAVSSILKNPDQDPHLFETSPSVARSIAGARIVIYNGADYDPWMEKMLGATGPEGRTVIVVADLLGRKSGDNPHLWYDPATAPAVARAIAERLAEMDPARKADYVARLAALDASLKTIAERAAAIRRKFADTPVTATEPVFGYMADALGLTMRNVDFQMSVMNGTEPSARDTAALEDDLKQHKVKVLFYNAQVADPQTEQLLALANQGGVPVVGVTETQPAGKSFVDWMIGELDATEKALSGPSS